MLLIIIQLICCMRCILLRTTIKETNHFKANKTLPTLVYLEHLAKDQGGSPVNGVLREEICDVLAMSQRVDGDHATLQDRRIALSVVAFERGDGAGTQSLCTFSIKNTFETNLILPGQKEVIPPSPEARRTANILKYKKSN